MRGRPHLIFTLRRSSIRLHRAKAEDAKDAVAQFDGELTPAIADGEFAAIVDAAANRSLGSSTQTENMRRGPELLALAKPGIVEWGSTAGLVAANIEVGFGAVAMADEVTPATILGSNSPNYARWLR